MITEISHKSAVEYQIKMFLKNSSVSVEELLQDKQRGQLYVFRKEFPYVEETTFVFDQEEIFTVRSTANKIELNQIKTY